MRVAARAATTHDLPALAVLVASCASALRSVRGGERFEGREFLLPPYGAELERLLSDCDTLVLSGTLDDEVLGIGVVKVERLAAAGVLGRLELLFVDPEAREVGLGEALVRAATAWAAARGATGLDAYALPGSREAKNFLESSGFVARLIVMHRDIGGPAGLSSFRDRRGS
jgi:GNAT superfamily N-acetyltransferase